MTNEIEIRRLRKELAENNKRAALGEADSAAIGRINASLARKLRDLRGHADLFANITTEKQN